MVTVKQYGKTFSTPQALAQENLSRKLSGRRIITATPSGSTLAEGKFYSEARKEYAKLRADPRIRRRFEARAGRVVQQRQPTTPQPQPTTERVAIPERRPQIRGIPERRVGPQPRATFQEQLAQPDRAPVTPPGVFRRIELGNDKRDFTYIRRTPLERAKLAGEQVAKDVRGLVSEEIPTRRAIGRQEQELVRSRGAPVKLLPLKSKPGERLSNPQKEYNKIVREVNKAIEQRDVKKIETVSKKLDEVQLPKAQLTPTEQRKVENLRRTLKEIPQFAPASGKFERPIQEFITVQGKIVRKTPETEAQRVRELEAEIEASIQERLQRPSIASPTIISERLTAEGRETALFQPEYGSFFYGLPPVQTVTTDIEATTLTPFKYVESSLIPAKTLQEDVYLPDQQAIDRYTKLIDESNILKGGFKGGELNVFLREQQAELQRDIGVFNTRKSEATAIIDNSRYRQLENRIKNNRATAEEVTEYNTLYKEYESKFNEAERLRSQILKGYKGTGWELLKDTSDQIKQRTSGRVDPTLARGLLRAGVAAYDVEKKVLAAQVGGTLLGATPIGSYATNALRTPLGIIGSKPVVFGAGGVSGATVGISEFAQSGDLPYAIGAGLGTTGGFLGSVYSRQIVETGGQGVRGLREFLTRDIGKAGKTQLSYINGGVAESKLAKEQLKKYKYTKKDAQNLRANISKLSRDRQVLEFRKIYNTVKNDPVKLKQFLRYAKLVFSKQVITTGMTPEPTQRVILTGPTTATKQSLFTGQGLYERTTGFQSPLSLDTTTTTATKSFIGGQSVSNQQNLVRGSDLFALIRQTPEQRAVSLLGLDKRQRLDQAQPQVERLGVGQTTPDFFPNNGQGFTPTTTTFTPTITTTPVIPGTTIGRPGTGLRPPTTPTTARPPFVPGLPDFERRRRQKKIPYDAEYIPVGETQYKKINKKPQTLASALSTMAKKVDQTLSARGRVIRTKQKVDKKGKKIPIQDTKDNYFQNNRTKFRRFRQRGGARTPLQSGEYIERQNFRLDTRGERKQIRKSRGRRRGFIL